jgi:hypothetical protein
MHDQVADWLSLLTLCLFCSAVLYGGAAIWLLLN